MKNHVIKNSGNQHKLIQLVWITSIVMRIDPLTNQLWMLGPSNVVVNGLSSVNSTGAYLALNGAEYVQIDDNVADPWMSAIYLVFKILPNASGIQNLFTSQLVSPVVATKAEIAIYFSLVQSFSNCKLLSSTAAIFSFVKTRVPCTLLQMLTI